MVTSCWSNHREDGARRNMSCPQAKSIYSMRSVAIISLLHSYSIRHHKASCHLIGSLYDSLWWLTPDLWLSWSDWDTPCNEREGIEMLFTSFKMCSFFSPRCCKKIFHARLDQFFLAKYEWIDSASSFSSGSYLLAPPSRQTDLQQTWPQSANHNPLSNTGGFDTMTDRGAPYGRAVEAIS